MLRSVIITGHVIMRKDCLAGGQLCCYLAWGEKWMFMNLLSWYETVNRSTAPLLSFAGYSVSCWAMRVSRQCITMFILWYVKHLVITQVYSSDYTQLHSRPPSYVKSSAGSNVPPLRPQSYSVDLEGTVRGSSDPPERSASDANARGARPFRLCRCP